MVELPRNWAGRLVAGVLVAAFAVPGARGQEADTLEMTLPEITVDAVRETETTATAPYALSVEIREPEAISYQPALSLDAVLRTIPGVWVNDRGHFALGERITVRGMGARAAFGVRGVQVLLDGIPLTMPDGQAVLDVVEPAVLRRIEMLRSPASLYWGNGSGGVLVLSSNARAEPLLRGRALAGAYGQRQVLLEGATFFDDHQIHAWASSQSQDGYRDYSEGIRNRGGIIGRFQLSERTDLRAVGAAAFQDTENPSSLTREQMDDDPTMARPDFVETSSGKVSTQGQLGATVDHDAALANLTLTAYGIRRSLENPLPFGFVDLQRTAGGLRAGARDEIGPLQWGVGADASIQHDVRKNYDNVDGERGEERTLDQIEDVTAEGAFAYGRVEVVTDLHATAGLRYSHVRFEMEDRLLDNDDQSGSRTFDAWSPMAGLSYQLPGVLLFANYGTAFETPTTTELVNRPDMTGGFNPELEPQLSRGVEVGARGALGAQLFFDAVAFYMDVDGRLISFENELGREYFRDAGSNTHKGIEAALEWLAGSGIEVQLSYSGSRFVFEDDELDGNLLPGVPEHRLAAAVELHRGGFWGRLESEAVSEYYVNDANTDVADGYVVFDLSLGHRGVAVGGARAQPLLTVRNVLDAQYSGSVVVNAFGGRYYEPSPGRAVLAGIEFSF